MERRKKNKKSFATPLKTAYVYVVKKRINSCKSNIFGINLMSELRRMECCLASFVPKISFFVRVRSVTINQF